MEAKGGCGGMMSVGQSVVSGEKDIDEDAVSRLDSAHFQVCKMLH
jgi:hypothetical protein